MQVLEFWPGVSLSAAWHRYWYSNDVNHHIMNFWRAGTPYPFVWNIKETGLSYKYRNAQLEHILPGGEEEALLMHALPLQRQQAISSLRRGKSNNEHFRSPESFWTWNGNKYTVSGCSFVHPFLCKLLTRVSWSNVWTKLEVILLNAWHRPKECWEVTAKYGRQRAETSLFCSLSETCNFFVIFLAKKFLCRSIKFISVIFYTKPTTLCRFAGRRGFKHTHS